MALWTILYLWSALVSICLHYHPAQTTLQPHLCWKFAALWHLRWYHAITASRRSSNLHKCLSEWILWLRLQPLINSFHLSSSTSAPPSLDSPMGCSLWPLGLCLRTTTIAARVWLSVGHIPLPPAVTFLHLLLLSSLRHLLLPSLHHLYALLLSLLLTKLRLPGRGHSVTHSVLVALTVCFHGLSVLISSVTCVSLP